MGSVDLDETILDRQKLMARCKHKAAQGPCEKRVKINISLTEKDSALLPNDFIIVQFAIYVHILPESILETGVSR